jgi:hypothetical protein
MGHKCSRCPLFREAPTEEDSIDKQSNIAVDGEIGQRFGPAKKITHKKISKKTEL